MEIADHAARNGTIGVMRRRNRAVGTCDCGKAVSVWPCRLTSGNTRSCGCLKAEKARAAKGQFAKGQAARNHLMARYRLGARKRKLDFTLSREEFAAAIRASIEP